MAAAGILEIVILFLTGGCVFGLTFHMFPDRAEAEARRRLGVYEGTRRSQSAIYNMARLLFPFFIPLVRLAKVPKYRESIEAKFVTAGMADEIKVDEFFAFKIVMGIFFPSFFGLTIGALIEPIPWWGLLLLGLYGFFFPDLWLGGRVGLRQKEMRRALPYVMDLLTLSVEAGLDFVAGISRVVEKSSPSALVEEFRLFLQELQLGVTRQEALRNLSKRVDMGEISAFVSLLVQADELGASIGPVLRAQSELLRTQRFQAAEKAGAQAAQKILFPLVLCILPAVFIMIFEPIVLSFIYGNGITGEG